MSKILSHTANMNLLATKLFVLALAALPANAYGAPLFESNDTLTITIVAPMRELLRHRSSEQKYDAVLSYKNASGVERDLDIKLKTRGHSRLEMCEFPPLRLTFDRDESRLTVFENQHQLKMVTQCESGSRGKSWVSKEFGIYRAYNSISDYSYRVRWLEVTFRDTESKRWKKVQRAFLIEPIGEAARRLKRESIRPPEIRSYCG